MRKSATTRWIVVVLFWILFAGSILLADRFAWIGAVWTILLLAIVVATSVYSVLNAGRDENGAAFQSGYPRWFMRFAMDEENERTREQPPDD